MISWFRNSINQVKRWKRNTQRFSGVQFVTFYTKTFPNQRIKRGTLLTDVHVTSRNTHTHSSFIRRAWLNLNRTRLDIMNIGKPLIRLWGFTLFYSGKTLVHSEIPNDFRWVVSFFCGKFHHIIIKWISGMIFFKEIRKIFLSL